MTGIVERLRAACQKGREDIEPWQCDPFLFDEAAAEIERLRAQLLDPTSYATSIRERDAEIERLRGIEQFVSNASRHEVGGLRAEIERLQAERDKAWTKHLIEREELKAEIERLREEGTVEVARLMMEIERLRTANDYAFEELAKLRASSGYEASIAQVEIERLRATVNAQSAAIERADRLVLACEQHLRDAKHEISKLRDDLTDEVL